MKSCEAVRGQLCDVLNVATSGIHSCCPESSYPIEDNFVLRVRVFGEDGYENERHDFAGDCLASPRDQALTWLHSQGFAYEETKREGERTWDEYESIRNPLFYATLEEL